MPNHFLHKTKELLKAVWKDFKNPETGPCNDSGCCGFAPPDPGHDLRAEAVKVIQKNSRKIKPKNKMP